MKTYSSDKKITIGLMGHNNTGKTSFAEALYFNCGYITRMGRTEDGNTVMDFEAEEKKRKQSINLSIGYIEKNETKIQILDNPGFLDFLGEIYSGLSAMDIAAIFANPGSPIEVGLEKALELVEEKNIPSFFVLNGIDKENSDFDKTYENLKEYSSLGVLPVSIPMGEKSSFKGIIDILGMKAYTYTTVDGKPEMGDIPSEYVDISKKYREKLIEIIAEATDDLTEKYLETLDLDAVDIQKGLSIGINTNKFRPLFVSSAVKNIGVDFILDTIDKYFPRYSDILPFKYENESQKVEFKRSENEKTFGFVFKTISDPHLGDIITAKIISGKVESGSEFYNINKRKKEKTGQLYILMGEKKVEVTNAIAGDIVSFVKLKITETGDLISNEEMDLDLILIEYPEPIYSIAIQPKSKEDQEKVSNGLQKINREDPSFKFFMDKEFGDFIISGMGDTHLQMILEKIKRKYGVELSTSNPQVPYRETITKMAESQGKYKKQSGGRGQFGDVWLKVEPVPQGFEFVDGIVGGVIPRNFIPSVEKGVRGALESGALAGYPVVNIKVTLYDGSYHTVDSSDMAFQIAGSMGFKNACEKSEMILLEPIYDFWILAPEDNLGDVMGDLSSRRGKILGTEQKKGKKIQIHAKVPLAEMFTYINTIKSMTGGRGFYSMKFSHYEPVPSNISQKIVEERKKKISERNQ